MQITIKQASVADIPLITSILEEAADWLQETGKPNWTKSRVSWEQLQKLYTTEDFYLGFLDDEPAGVAAIVEVDKEYWPEIPTGTSLFVHKLAVRRYAAKTGVSEALMAKASEIAKARGIGMVRLDCRAERAALRRFYERLGYGLVKEEQRPENPFVTAFYCKYMTEVCAPDADSLAKAASLLQKGEVVGIPTETVYGLAADALNPLAVAKIFTAKGRPGDNPLIVHIDSLSMMERLTTNLPLLAYQLAERFWSGALTMILPRSPLVPDVVTAGLDTVAIRMPDHPIAQAVIRESGCPLAAPSANRSGSPSPTKAAHVFADMDGRIPLILDGGSSSYGVESTVIAVLPDRVRLLRPGGVTLEQLETVCPVEVDDGVLTELAPDAKVSSPGMKYKHYSPAAEVFIVDATPADFASFLEEHQGDGVFAMAFEDEKDNLSVFTLTFGQQDNPASQARVLFKRLRQCDELGASVVYVHAPEKAGIGLAVYNRLLRAAAFRVITLDGGADKV